MASRRRGRPSEPPRQDLGRQAVTILAFGVSLGATTLVFPLLALDAGFGLSAVGAFTAVSAGVQLGVRLFLPAILERVSDRSLIVVAAAILGASFAVLLVVTTVVTFLVAQSLQGASRALFWTASQTHSVRGSGSETRPLAIVQMLGTGGGLVGPVIAGAAVAWISLRAGLVGGVIAAAVSVMAGLTLRYDPPYQRAPDHVPIWRLEGIGLSAWAGTVGGAWRGVLDSFVPAVLSSAGIGPAVIGWLVALADGSSFLVTASIARWSIDDQIARAVPVAALAVCGAMAALPFVSNPATAVAVMAVGGVGGGLGLVLAPAAASLIATEGEQGAGIALAGTYRAGARFATPGAVSALTTMASVSWALPVVAAGLLAPLPMMRRWLTRVNE